LYVGILDILGYSLKRVLNGLNMSLYTNLLDPPSPRNLLVVQFLVRCASYAMGTAPA
jgi:hypothetical protein